MTYIEATKWLYMRGIDRDTRATILADARRNVFTRYEDVAVWFKDGKFAMVDMTATA